MPTVNDTLGSIRETHRLTVENRMIGSFDVEQKKNYVLF
jgi:hypothetical protein